MLSTLTRLNTGFNVMDVMVGAMLALVNLLILQEVFIVIIVLIHEMFSHLPFLTLLYFVVITLMSAR